MHDKFKMNKLGDLKSILNLQITQVDNGIFISESKYLRSCLKRFDLENAKSIKTPMSIDLKLTLDKDRVSVDSSKYRCMIGCLPYIIDYRPDIMFSVSLCARFQENPKESHMDTVLWIFRYIKNTQYMGLWYLNGSGIKVCVYADSDHAGDYVDSKSTSGACTFVGGCLTQWCCKKQVAAERACQQALWMKQAIKDYGIHCEDVLVLCDNKGAIGLSKNPVHRSLTKYIKIHHHSLRDNVQKGNILMVKVAYEDNITDILTKPLKRETFNYLRLRLGMLKHEE
ncbi:retrovirus-related pol polyprotein from transposon TNT 1-94 [Tanacetum coccineum]